MFPNPPQMGVARHTTTPSAASAASVAAGHAYFQANYHAHVAAAAYGAHSHPAHQYPGGYSAANLAADLNSNMYNGGQNGQFMSDNNWSSAASQWPAFSHPPISSSASAGSTACGRFENWPQQQQQQQQQQNNNEDSPPTPNNNDTAGLPAASGGRSPGNYAQSHSSGSPSATPTPAGVQANTAQSYQPDMFNNKFTPNFGGGGHSPNGPMQNLESSSPLNSHMGSGELNPICPMASPVSLASPSSRPQPARSPYEWMKKPSYQSQPEKQGEFLILIHTTIINSVAGFGRIRILTIIFVKWGKNLYKILLIYVHIILAYISSLKSQAIGHYLVFFCCCQYPCGIYLPTYA